MSRTMTVVARGEEVVFESPYTDGEALDKLNIYVNQKQIKSDFAYDLARKGLRGRLSSKQVAWIHKMVVDYEAPRDDMNGVRLMNIVKIIQTAKEKGIKWPVIRVDTDNALPGIRVGAASETVDHYINVRSLEKPEGADKYLWYGKIYEDGKFEGGYRCHDKIKAVLVLLNSDPTGIARTYGRRTGNCCFCGRELTRADSISCGYGPICADKYGLYHGFWDEQASRESREETSALRNSREAKKEKEDGEEKEEARTEAREEGQEARTEKGQEEQRSLFEESEW